MDHTLRALRISEKVADGIPLPGLKSAINVALSIAEMAEEAKSTREQFRELAERAGRFTLAVYEQLRGCDADVGSIETTEHVANFLCALEDIEVYMRRQGRKRLFKVMLSSGRKDDEVARLTTRLEDAVRLFHIQTSLHANAQLSLIAGAQNRLLAHADDADRVGAIILSRTHIVEAGISELVRRDATADGTLKLFGREDIDLLDELEPEMPWPTSDAAPVMRYRAQIRQSGSVVVVRRFPRNDDRFRCAVEVSKRIWHPYIIQTIGVSRPDPYQAFIVQDGVGTNGAQLLDRLRKLRGLDKLSYVIQCMKQLSSAFDYMEENGMNLPSREDDMHNLFPQDLVLRPNGALQWDLSNWAMPVLPGFIELPKLLLQFDRDLIKVLSTPSRDSLASIERIWSFLSQANQRRCCRSVWAFPVIPSIGQCFLINHGNIWSARSEPATIRWKLSGPRRHCCFFDALSAMRPGQFCRDKSCKRRVMFEGDSDDGVAGVTEEAQGADVAVVEKPSRIGEPAALSDGWRRHTVDMTVADPILGFKLTIAGPPAKDLGRWLSEEVLRNDAMCEFAADLAIAVKVRICISTGRVLLRPCEDGTQSFDIPAIAGPGDPHTVLYFYENFSTLRSEGVFEVPVGYWSTSPDDLPTVEELTRRGPHREMRNIVHEGSTENGSTMWVQQLRDADSGSEVYFCSQTRVYIDKCHFSLDECALLREIRPSLKHHVCESSIALSHESDD